ncbi:MULTISPECIES: DedA family protein/thiosulfate sulfurtransferase GlpE [Ramlibacter]|uniref:Sulfurtransferase n=1 Tax=Ramlibacter pinisoli TaxID=2682844 RepID=A0A6N8IVS2_9BURK|nr:MULTISPECIES: DedA family protein/thiosulfate sulfurtransferase GlpE [Ramlibacter]MBA2960942.1 VTT domain-containing protein [Ramlibacter sp. CGMCC 1.13660]MVQ30888.1 sulfurtransferase [Ramlibacter pinisoli]
MQTLIDLLIRHDALAVFLVTLAARIGLPVPAAPLLVVAGGLAAGGRVSLAFVLAVSTAANVLGDGVWFLAGRRYGYRMMRLLCRISLEPDSCVRQSETLVARWGGRSLLAAKFVPGVSLVAAPMAGALGMTARRFVCYDLVAGALWAAAFLGLGLLFNQQIQELLSAMANAGMAAVALLVLALGAFVAYRWWRRRRFLREVAAAGRVTAAELREMMERGEEPVVIDVRGPATAHLDPRRIPGAVLIDLGEIAAHAPRLPRDRDIVLYCNCPNEASAAKAAGLLIRSGLLRARPLTGGLDGWVEAGLPVATA